MALKIKYGVTGAGDTVLAALAVGMTGKGLDIQAACEFAAGARRMW